MVGRLFLGVWIAASLLGLAVAAPEETTAPHVSGAAATAQAEAVTPPLTLTAEQHTWLSEHPVIRVAATQDWPPFEFVDAEGTYKGICAELFLLLSQRIGLHTELVLGDWSKLYGMLKTNELDLYPAMGITPEREESLLFTAPLLDFPHAIYVREGEQGIVSLDDLEGKNVSVERDYYTQEFLDTERPGIRLNVVDNTLQALLEVANHKVDAYIGNTAVSSYLIDQNVILGLTPIWCAEVDSLRLAIGVRKDYAPLVDILNRAIAGLTPLEKRQIVARYALLPQWVELSEAEYAWTSQHPVIRLGVDPEFAPFEFVGADGSYQGMASDYVQLLNQRLGLNMKVVHTSRWVDAPGLASARELDVLPCVGMTMERHKQFLFSEPYLSFYRVIVTRENGPLITGFRDLTGIRVAVQENSSHHGFLIEHSDIAPLLFDTVRATLAAVARGEADAAVGNVATVSYWIRKLGLSNLRIAAPIDTDVNHLYFAVRRDWPELVAILNKGLASISEEEANAIRKKWVDVSVESGLDWDRVFQIVALVVFVAALSLALLGLHNRRLRKEIRVRTRAEEALRRSEADYRTLVEGANSVILRMTTDGTVVFVNAFAERFFGYSADEIIGKSVVGTIVPETETQGRDLRELMADLARNPERYEANENENMTKSGGRVWVAWTNRPLCDMNGDLKEILCVGTDMTARKRAEEVLFRYEFIVNTVDDMMSVLNAGGCYEAVNTAWCAAMNIDRQAVIGKTVQEVWSPDVGENLIWPGLSTCLSGELVTYESLVEFPARGERHCEVTMYPYADATGGVTHAVVVTHDVTDWRTAQAALKEAKRAAEAANRAKSAFLANMSHEIRTPMNAILGYTQLLRRQAGLSPGQEHALDAISRSGDHLLALINDVLDMSKIEAGRADLHPSTFNLRGLLSDMEVMFRVRTQAKGLKLNTEVGASVPQLIRADENRVRQILINLLGNAVKFTDQGGISVHLKQDGVPDGKTCTLAIEVEDSGCGIPPEDHDAIFESFEQAGSASLRRGGTGLGLAISRRFARMMGGDITVTSGPAVGSRFRFTMTAECGHKADIETPLPERHVKYLRPGQGEVRVLVVDDRATNRDLLCRLLEKVGFATREAENGAEGLEIFAEWQPQVVLMDLVMPIMNGREAIQEIRRMPQRHEATIIAVTASTLDDAKAEILAQGADAFLRKPFRANELFELIHGHADVEFEYEAERQPERQEDEAKTLNAAGQAWAALPGELRRRLRHAIIMGSIDDTSAVANELRERAPELAAVIDKHAHEFALDHLEMLLDNWGDLE